MRHDKLWIGILQNARQQREVIVLHKDERGSIASLLEHGLCEQFIDLAVGLPIFRIENRLSKSDVAQRPEGFVRKAVIIALFLFLG